MLLKRKNFVGNWKTGQMAVNLGQSYKGGSMVRKKNKPASPKPYTSHPPKSILEEPAVAYAVGSTHSLKVIHGSRPEKNYVKRSLVLMGLDTVAPFNTVENVSDFYTMYP